MSDNHYECDGYQIMDSSGSGLSIFSYIEEVEEWYKFLGSVVNEIGEGESWWEEVTGRVRRYIGGVESINKEWGADFFINRSNNRSDGGIDERVKGNGIGEGYGQG